MKPRWRVFLALVAATALSSSVLAHHSSMRIRQAATTGSFPSTGAGTERTCRPATSAIRSDGSQETLWSSKPSTFNDETWLTDNGAFHTKDLKVVERLRRVGETID